MLWAKPDEEDSTDFKEKTNDTLPVYLSMCSRMNQTESKRIYFDLSHLTGNKPDKRNLSKFFQSNFKGKTENEFIESYIENDVPNKKQLNEKSKPLSKRLNKQIQREINGINQVPSASSFNAVQVYPPMPEEYAKLFDILGRRDDTLYVVYLTQKDLYLPALNPNSTVRPRMSLVIPALPDGKLI